MTKSFTEAVKEIAQEMYEQGPSYPTTRALETAMHKARELLEQDVKELVEALERLTKVGPPSRPCTGAEWAEVALKDNCEIANDALEKWNARGK